MKYSKKIVSIQHLRGLAAISVLGAHTFWGFGDIGVDLFFVISGFIMFYIIDLKPNKSSISFFFDRYLRIAPIYYLFTLLYVLSGFTTITDLNQIIQSLTFVKYFETSPLLSIGWTLEYEFAFYSICALSIFLFKKISSRKYFIIFTLFAFFIVFDLIIYSDKLYGHFLEFFFGTIIYELYKKKILFSNQIMHLGCLLILSAFLVVGHNYYSTIGFTYLRFLVFGFPSAIILYLALSNETKWLSNNFLSILGDASYSIYISHTFVFHWLYKITQINRHESLYFDIISFFIAICFGVLVYYIIEKPSYNAINKLRRNILLKKFK